MRWRGRLADTGCLWDTRPHTRLTHSTINEVKVNVALLHVSAMTDDYGLTQGAFGTQGLSDDAHITIDEGKAAVLDNR